MPGIVRLSIKELNELIEVTEAAEGDATELKRLLAEVTEDERLRKLESRREWLAAREGGMTTEEHVEVGLSDYTVTNSTPRCTTILLITRTC